MNAAEVGPNQQYDSFGHHVLGSSFEERPSLGDAQKFLIETKAHYGGLPVVREVAAELKSLVEDADVLLSPAPADETARRERKPRWDAAMERRSRAYISNTLAGRRAEAHARLLSICLVHKELLEGELGEFLFAREYLPRTVRTAVIMLDECISRNAYEFLSQNLEKIAASDGNSEAHTRDFVYALMGPLLKRENNETMTMARNLLIELSKVSQMATENVSYYLVRALMDKCSVREEEKINPRVQAALLSLVREHERDAERIKIIVKKIITRLNHETTAGAWQMHKVMMDVAATGDFVNKSVSEKYAYGICVRGHAPRDIIADGCSQLAEGKHPNTIIYALFRALAKLNENQRAWMMTMLRGIARKKPEEVFECINNWKWEQDAWENFDRRPHFVQLLAEVAPFMPAEVLDFTNKPAGNWGDFDFTEVRLRSKSALQLLRHPAEAMPVSDSLKSGAGCGAGHPGPLVRRPNQRAAH